MVAINRNQYCSIHSRGRLIDDRKRATKKSGNALSTASTDPVFIASMAPMPPNPRATSTVRSTITTMPKNPLLTSTPISVPTMRKTMPCRKPSMTTPVSIPPSNATGRIGVSESLSKKPLSMSRARSAPAVIAPNREACISGKANAKSRYESVGKPGIFEAALRPFALMEKNNIGKSREGTMTAGCLRVRTVERRAIARTSVNSGEASGPAGEPDGHGAWLGRNLLPELPKYTYYGVALRALGGRHLDAGASDLGLQGLRRVLGDDPTPVDDPDPVSQHVGLLQVLRRQEHGDAFISR